MAPLEVSGYSWVPFHDRDAHIPILYSAATVPAVPGPSSGGSDTWDRALFSGALSSRLRERGPHSFQPVAHAPLACDFLECR